MTDYDLNRNVTGFHGATTLLAVSAEDMVSIFGEPHYALLDPPRVAWTFSAGHMRWMTHAVYPRETGRAVLVVATRKGDAVEGARFARWLRAELDPLRMVAVAAVREQVREERVVRERVAARRDQRRRNQSLWGSR